MVELSSAGHKRNHNPDRVKTGFGIITNYIGNKTFPYEMMWFSKTHDPQSFSAKEYEIQKVKTPKSNKNKNNS
jgi:hypothetical protein